MKCIGLLGGMSWESTVLYYQILNRAVQQKLGGLHSALCILYSVDFQPIEEMQHNNNWNGALSVLKKAALSLEKAGAELLIICTNTMHLLAPEIEKSLKIPILHIADATAEVLVSQNLKTVGLLGTRFTMEKDFYIRRLNERYGIKVIVPPEKKRIRIHDIIYKELCVGVIKKRSKTEFHKIIDGLVGEGAEGVILGCTEIGMLVHQTEYDIPVFDTTRIHAEAAVHRALSV
jgi:aspartate racemase